MPLVCKLEGKCKIRAADCHVSKQASRDMHMQILHDWLERLQSDAVMA